MMEDEAEPTVWQETTGQAVAVRLSTLPSTGSAALSTEVRPIIDTPDNRRAFAAALTPSLALVAPSGMGQQERKAWLAAAFAALSHLPMDLIAAGAKEAAKTADHPSKIVPAIIAATEHELSWRRRNQHHRAASEPVSALPAPGQERATPDEVDDICKRFAVGRYATVQPHRDPARPIAQPAHADPQRPCRTPTREDYLRMGVAAEVLDCLATREPEPEASTPDQLAA